MGNGRAVQRASYLASVRENKKGGEKKQKNWHRAKTKTPTATEEATLYFSATGTTKSMQSALKT